MMVLLGACSSMPDMKTAEKAYINEDYSSARNHYEQLSEFGYPKAKVELGKMYLYGKGVDADPQKALTLFEEAEAAGDDRYAPRLIPKAQEKIAKQAAKEARLRSK